MKRLFCYYTAVAILYACGTSAEPLPIEAFDCHYSNSPSGPNFTIDFNRDSANIHMSRTDGVGADANTVESDYALTHDKQNAIIAALDTLSINKLPSAYTDPNGSVALTDGVPLIVNFFAATQSKKVVIDTPYPENLPSGVFSIYDLCKNRNFQ